MLHLGNFMDMISDLMNIVHYDNVMKLQCMKEMWDYGAIALVIDSTKVF